MLLLTLTKTRYAGFTPMQARLVTLVVAIAIAYGLTLTQDLTWTKKLADPASGDSANYARIAERVRNGENYYAAAHYELKNNNYRTSSVFDFRLPTLALLTANMPKPVMAQFLLGALGVVNLFLWLRYWLELEKSLLNACLGGILLMGSTLPCFLSVSSYFHEIWAGTLLSISIVTHSDKRWGVSVAAGVAALFFRELSLPYLLIMLAFALREKRMQEAQAWLAGLVAFAIYLGIHASFVSGVAEESALTGSRWLQMGGWKFLLRTTQSNALLLLSPDWVKAVAFPLALLGLAGWNSKLGARVIITTATFSLAFLIAGQKFNVYWGLMYAHLIAVGLTYSLSAVVDVGRSSLGLCEAGHATH
jgi:hypothetical protein